MKIIGFTQLRNELSRGNLHNWLRCMSSCDVIYIIDQASDDGSQEVYKQYKNVVVIQNETNRFTEEMICKSELFEKIKKVHSPDDWIYWLDGDLIMDGRMLADNGKKMRELLDVADKRGSDAILFGHYNLWRSDVWYRTDNSYHGLHGRWFVFWKNANYMWIPPRTGLHWGQAPDGIRSVINCDAAVMHRGFSDGTSIVNKYLSYKKMGQKGWDLDRLIDESTLSVERVPDKIIPEWYSASDNSDPRLKVKLIDLHKDIIP